MIVMRQTDGEGNRGSERSGKGEGNVVKSRLLVTISILVSFNRKCIARRGFFLFFNLEKGREREGEKRGK